MSSIKFFSKTLHDDYLLIILKSLKKAICCSQNSNNKKRLQHYNVVDSRQSHICPPEVCATVLERLALYAKIRSPLNNTDKELARL